MPKLIFNSRSPQFKSPFGAVPAETKITFRAAVKDCPSAECPVLNIFSADHWDRAAFSEIMRPDGSIDGLPSFTAEFTPPSPALLFYDFSLCGTVYRCGDGGSAVADLCEHFQLTVYDGGTVPSDELYGGIMYQIFPDRFAKGKETSACPYKDRRFHSSWSELPEWSNISPATVNKDYFGGNLSGIREKLDYLASLSVTCIYLNPIFESHSNHRYDTADYMKIDPLLGTEDDFKALCRDAGERGMMIILDGVFNHTGGDSRYFDLYGRYGGHGAYQHTGGPYDSWYDFGSKYRNGYRSWWDFPNLPSVNHDNPDFRRFICGRGGVIEHWISAGASGFRLDVADELSDSFISEIRQAVYRCGGRLLLGEVWDDASNKISYGIRRRYLLGNELDCVMNYPVKDALLQWLRNGGKGLEDVLCRITENYPAPALNLTMNMLSTHDTVRALAALACEPCGRHDKQWQAAHHFPSPGIYGHGKRLLLLGFAILFALPGIPSIYYGDEAGMYGYLDPFNRCCYPWGNEDAEILNTVRALGHVRRDSDALRDGAFIPIEFSKNLCCFGRRGKSVSIYIAANRCGESAVRLPAGLGQLSAVYGTLDENGCLAPLSAVILK